MSKLLMILFSFSFFGFFRTNCSLESLPIELFEQHVCRFIVRNAIRSSDISDSTSFKQNGARVNLFRKVLFFDDIFNLLRVSKAIYTKTTASRQFMYQYWFKKRKMLRIAVEASFQLLWASKQGDLLKGFLYHDYQNSYLKIVQYYQTHKYEQFRNHFRAYPVPDFLLVGLSQRLLEICTLYNDKQVEVGKLNNEIYDAFFAYDQSYKKSLCPGDGLRFVFVVLLSLGFFIPGSNQKEMIEIKKNFIGLKALFDKLAVTESLTEGIVDQNEESVAVQFAKSEIFQFGNSARESKGLSRTDRLLLDVELILQCMYGFENLFIMDNYEYYKNFSHDKKIAFLYFNLEKTSHIETKTFFSFPIIKHLWLCKASVYLSKKFLNFHEPCRSMIFSECSFLIGPLLKLYDINTVFYLLKNVSDNVPDIEGSVKQLFSSYPQTSYELIAQNFFLFLEKDWPEQFKLLFEKSSIESAELISQLGVDRLLSKNQSFEKVIEKQKAEIEGIGLELSKATREFENELLLKVNLIEAQNQNIEKLTQKITNQTEEIVNLKQTSDEKSNQCTKLGQELAGVRAELIKAKADAQVEKESSGRLINEAQKKCDEDKKSYEKEVNQLGNKYRLWKKKVIGFFLVAQLFLVGIYFSGILRKVATLFKISSNYNWFHIN